MTFSKALIEGIIATLGRGVGVGAPFAHPGGMGPMGMGMEPEGATPMLPALTTD